MRVLPSSLRAQRDEFLPGTGRGTAPWRWRGRLKLDSYVDDGALPNPAPPSLRATSPFRGGFSALRAFAAKFILSACKPVLSYAEGAVEGRETNLLFSSREAAKTRRVGE